MTASGSIGQYAKVAGHSSSWRVPSHDSSGNKIDSKNYRPVMNSSNFIKVLEYLLLQHLEKYLPIHLNQIAYRPGTGCIDGITVLKETVMYYNLKTFWCLIYNGGSLESLR